MIIVTFLLQVKKSNQKNPPLSIFSAKIQGYPHTGKLLYFFGFTIQVTL